MSYPGPNELNVLQAEIVMPEIQQIFSRELASTLTSVGYTPPPPATSLVAGA